MTRGGDEDIEGVSEHFYTPEGGALKKLLGKERGSEIFTTKGAEGFLKN